MKKFKPALGLMSLFGIATDPEKLVPSEKERADMIAEMAGNRNAAGIFTSKKDKKRLAKQIKKLPPKV